MKKIIGIFMLTLMIICSVGACGTTKLSGSGEEKALAEVQKEDIDKQNKEEKEKETEEEEYLDVDSVEDTDVDYSKYEEKSASEGENSDEGEEKNAGNTNQDKYSTTPVPEGMPTPVEPDDAEVDISSEGTCYLSISCATVLDNMENLTQGKESVVPSDGVILDETEVSFYEGESVFDVLQRVTKNNRIHMESSFTPAYNSAYVEGIHNLYEYDCGELSGWMFAVNGWYPNYGCSRYQVQDGDVIQWNYTCDQGRDLGQTWVK